MVWQLLDVVYELPGWQYEGEGVWASRHRRRPRSSRLYGPETGSAHAVGDVQSAPREVTALRSPLRRSTGPGTVGGIRWSSNSRPRHVFPMTVWVAGRRRRSLFEVRSHIGGGLSLEQRSDRLSGEFFPIEFAGSRFEAVVFQDLWDRHALHFSGISPSNLTNIWPIIWIAVASGWTDQCFLLPVQVDRTSGFLMPLRMDDTREWKMRGWSFQSRVGVRGWQWSFGWVYVSLAYTLFLTVSALSLPVRPCVDDTFEWELSPICIEIWDTILLPLQWACWASEFMCQLSHEGERLNKAERRTKTSAGQRTDRSHLLSLADVSRAFS